MNAYEQLYVVSDLHLGGAPGFQIFDQGATLSALIDLLRQSESSSLALVLNGDVVDFLAEPGAVYFDANGAVDRLKRIMSDSAFCGVFSALGKFLSTPGRTLWIVGGNHDVELSLPNVQTFLTNTLCADEAAKARLRFATAGAGLVCAVGRAKVLCIHGNEVDSWNMIDYLKLLWVNRALNRQMPLPDWTPNGGTQLVVDVMNAVKVRFPFVDLLKPEKLDVLFPILLSLDRSVAAKLAKVAAARTRAAADAMRHELGFLGAVEPAEVRAGSERDALEQILQMGRGSQDKVESGRDPLERAQDAYARRKPGAMDITNVGDETLGKTGLLLDFILNRPAEQNLREQLQSALVDDRTFDARLEDDDFIALDKDIGADIDFLISGHTHLHRALKRKKGSGYYYNSGTWISLIKLRSEQLASAEAFKPVYDALRDGTMSALDSHPGMITRRPTVVSIIAKDGRVNGSLGTVQQNPTHIVPIDNTQFSV